MGGYSVIRCARTGPGRTPSRPTCSNGTRITKIGFFRRSRGLPIAVSYLGRVRRFETGASVRCEVGARTAGASRFSRARGLPPDLNMPAELAALPLGIGLPVELVALPPVITNPEIRSFAPITSTGLAVIL